MKENRTVVIKIGSSSITNKEIGLNLGVIGSITRQSALLFEDGYRLAIVTSGAVAAGRVILGIGVNGDTEERQIAASFGQPKLISAWVDAFEEYGIRRVSQFLLTGDDLEGNIRPLVGALNHGIPVINANDPVNDSEMENYAVAADNDQLAGHVAERLQAHRLILLTDVDGVFNRHDKLIRSITSFAEIEGIVIRGGSGLGMGGMVSKLNVAWKAALQGRVAWIANAKEEDIILKIVSGEKIGTKIYKP